MSGGSGTLPFTRPSRVALRRRDRDEVEEISGQRWVPVLIDGDDVICDSHRIVEFVEHRKTQRSVEVA